MFVNRRRLWAPKASHIPPVTLSFLSFFFFPLLFFTFLSFSLLLYLFFFLFFRAKNSYSLTTHTHSVLFAFFQFSVLFVLSFLFFSHQSLTRWPTPTQAERSSASIFDHTSKNSPRIRSPHRCYHTCSSIWPERQNGHPQQRSGWSVEISIHSNYSIWKLYCRRQEQLRWKLVFDLEAPFFSFSFFSWCIINKYEWSFEFGVMSCFRWC